MLITPELAEQWLERNVRNRPMSENTVIAYGLDMLEGRWQHDGAPIRFDTDGNLIDGQHRLKACIDSGVSFEKDVIFGLPPGAILTIDIHRPRTSGHIAAIQGFHNAACACAIAGLIVLHRRHGIERMNDPRCQPTKTQVVEAARTLPALEEAVVQARLLGKKIAEPILVVDEMSKVDVALAWRLFQAVDRTRTAVVLVGDHNQLPPVGPGNILRDLVRSRAIPTTVLTRIIRQAGVLKENSIAILSGEARPTAEVQTGARRPWYVIDKFTDRDDVRRMLLLLFEEVLQEWLGYDLVRDVQVLTRMHKCPLCTVELNLELQRLLQRRLFGIEVAGVEPGHRAKLYAGDGAWRILTAARLARKGQYLHLGGRRFAPLIHFDRLGRTARRRSGLLGRRRWYLPGLPTRGIKCKNSRA